MPLKCEVSRRLAVCKLPLGIGIQVCESKGRNVRLLELRPDVTLCAEKCSSAELREMSEFVVFSPCVLPLRPNYTLAYYFNFVNFFLITFENQKYLSLSSHPALNRYSSNQMFTRMRSPLL